MISKKHVMIFKVVLVLGVASSVFADGHYAYSEQTIKKFHDPHAYSGHHGELSHIGSHKPEHHEGYAWAYPAYEFSYKVEDHHTHDYKGQHEMRDGDTVKGMYWLIQPDGKKRTVTYHADKHSGFHAQVEYSDPDHHIYHEKKHEDHHEPEHHVKHLEHHVEHHDEHHRGNEEEHHKKYYSKPYGYHSAVIHLQPQKHLDHHTEHHEDVHKEHHVEIPKGHHEDEHNVHHEKSHVPHSDYHVHIEHPKYYGHYNNEHHHEHKHVEDHHNKYDVKVVEAHHEQNHDEHHNEHHHKYHDDHHEENHYDEVKKIYAHHLDKPHHEQYSDKHHYRYDPDHILYIDHKLLEDLRQKAYQAFKAHEYNNDREHHYHHNPHSKHYYQPVHHERQNIFHHILPMSSRKH